MSENFKNFGINPILRDGLDAVLSALDDNQDSLSNIQDQINSLEAIIGQIEVSYGKIKDIENFVASNIDCDADTNLESGDSGALQSAINTASDSEIISVNTNATYDPITLPNSKSVIIRAGNGYSPCISGQHAVLIEDGAMNSMVSGFSFISCSTLNSNWKGACVGLEHRGKFNNIIFHRCSFQEVVNGSAIMISYHQSISGDNYATTPTYPDDYSEKLGIIDCNFFYACKDAVEGAAISLRAVSYAYIKGCRVNGNSISSRGIQAQNCKNIVVDGNILRSFGTGNSEAIKLDLIGSDTSNITTGVIKNNICFDCVEGIDIDDYVSAFAHNNICVNCIDEGISIDNNSQALIVGNITCHCANGILAENGSITKLFNNCSFNNTVQNYKMDNGYVPDSSNLSAPLKFEISDMMLYVPETTGDWDSTPDNVKSALDELATRVRLLELV